MKICATVAEYNPLHNGHIKHFEYMRNTLNAEKIIVIMSGNFTQRGEPAILDKFTRAKNAILAGADMVIELPTIFANANAEIFASGAISILNDLNVVDGICFGAESGDTKNFISTAKILNNETKDFKKLLRQKLDDGFSFVKAKYQTMKDLDNTFDDTLILSPNNILGVEYSKALDRLKSDIKIYPMQRTGEHNDKTLKKGITSATSIREAIKRGEIKKVKKNLPKYVYSDLEDYPFDFDKIIMTKLLTSSLDDLSNILDCTEGLENRIKALSKENKTIDELVSKCTTKRYTSSRIRRILISNLLDIKKDFVINALSTPLYAKVLAVKKESKDLISEVNKNSSIPLITRKSDVKELKKIALSVFDKDVLANEIYSLAKNKKYNEYAMLII